MSAALGAVPLTGLSDSDPLSPSFPPAFGDSASEGSLFAFEDLLRAFDDSDRPLPPELREPDDEDRPEGFRLSAIPEATIPPVDRHRAASSARESPSIEWSKI